jgi:hypothetical protein
MFRQIVKGVLACFLVLYPAQAFALTLVGTLRDDTGKPFPDGQHLAYFQVLDKTTGGELAAGEVVVTQKKGTYVLDIPDLKLKAGSYISSVSAMDEDQGGVENAAGPKSYHVISPAADSGLEGYLLPSQKPKYMDIRVKDGGITAAKLASDVTMPNADMLDGQHGSFYQNASNINSGMLGIDRIDPSGAPNGAVLTNLGVSLSWQLPSGSGGDITSVSAGAGLTGGAMFGDATLSILNGGITTPMFSTSAKAPDSGKLDGQDGPYYRDAANLTGFLPLARLDHTGATSGQAVTWNGSTTVWASPGAGLYWGLGGNPATNPAINYVGTSDAQPLVIRTNGAERVRIDAVGRVGIGTIVPSAALDVNGTAQMAGFRMPTSANNGYILTSDAVGAGTWQPVPGSLGWSLKGNAGTNPATNYLGTSDAQNLVIRTFGMERARVTYDGLFGIGTNDPKAALDVGGLARVGGFQMPTGAAGGYVLTSDSAGIGSWQRATGGSGWALDGNGGTSAGQNFLGTTDNQALEIKVNGSRAMRFEPGAASVNVIGGSGSALAGVYGATIGGGGGTGGATNVVTDNYGTVGGGYSNRAGNNAGTAGDTEGATVSGGRGNTANGPYSAVGGGYLNTASGTNSTVPGGVSSTAQGNYSLAAGRRAKANAQGAFAWADSLDSDFTVVQTDRFAARASGGVSFYTKSDLTIGAYLAANSGTWVSMSDRNAKEHIAEVDSREVLAKVSALPVTAWRYKGEDHSIRHVGPMAQDFRAAFGLGDSDKGIATIDADGIAFAAIQGLSQALQEKDAELKATRDELTALRSELRALAVEVRKTR